QTTNGIRKLMEIPQIVFIANRCNECGRIVHLQKHSRARRPRPRSSKEKGPRPSQTRPNYAAIFGIGITRCQYQPLIPVPPNLNNSDKWERRGIESTLSQPTERHNPHKCGGRRV